PGEHVIEFRYWSSAAVTGMLISCLTLVLLGVWTGLKIMNKPGGYWVTVGTGAAALGIFIFWYASLYGGDNLGTRYSWQTPPPDRPVNLAFGKWTAMSSHTPGYPYRYHSRQAVDGGRGVDSCFFTAEEDQPWWTVDLKTEETVARVALFTGFDSGKINQLPLILSLSTDGRHWQPVKIKAFDREGRALLVFDPPRQARYIHIQASEKTVLSLNEVEVYSAPLSPERR
ncbi:MAG: discoidin domain-containing protein, partial [Desulfosudaceae bacterium]